MKTELKPILKYFSQTMLFVYLVAFGAAVIVLPHKLAIWHANAAGLSRLQPSYAYLARFADGKVPFDREVMEDYRLFFTQILRVLWERPDAHGMLGFCQYHLGNTDRAIAEYKKALSKAPYFMWYNHNLAVLYFQKKDYKLAAKYAGEAVRNTPDVVARFMMASKLYMDLVISVPGLNQQLPGRLDIGYRDSYKILVLSYFHQKRFTDLIVIADVAVNQKLDDDGFFYYYLGVGAFNSNQFERAALYLREALKKNSQSAEAYYFLALSLKALNKEEMAVSALQKAEVFAQIRGPSYETIKNLKIRIF